MRIIFDISTVARRFGPPGGIGRVERELATYAFKHRPDVTFSFYDRSIGRFREARREWLPDLIGPEALLDLSTAPSRDRMAWGSAVPKPRSGKMLRVRRLRHEVQVALERVRLTSASPAARSLAAHLLVPISRLSSKYRKTGLALSILPFDLAIGEPLSLDADCILVSVGNDWSYKDPEQLLRLRAADRFRYAILCHDLILVQFPELVGERINASMRRYWLSTFRLSDLVIMTTRTVERDVLDFWRDNALAPASTAIVPLGFDPHAFAGGAASELPRGLEPQKYVLMVGAIEKRKGHELLIRIWKKLLAEGVPQAQGFKLVFVGEFMFNTPHLKDMLRRKEAGPTLLHLRGILDGQLATLYKHAAFCVLPSRYEGFGLPAVEAFGAGRALIASTGGAVPEVVDGLAPCIDPDDEDAWYNEIRRWIIEPGVRAEHEQKIRSGFKMPTWNETGERFFSAIEQWADGEATTKATSA
jgi:glycosyltransferase involved in cell wall biosynthesis